MNKKIIIISAAAIIVLGATVALAVREKTEKAPGLTAIVYRSPTCGCCSNYAAALKKEGYNVEVVPTDDMAGVKSKYHIPAAMESCHTTVIGDKVIEGHMPIKVVDQFLADDGAKTIALPGMPSGSPGMPGQKQGLFTIYEIDESGGTSVYAEF